MVLGPLALKRGTEREIPPTLMGTDGVVEIFETLDELCKSKLAPNEPDVCISVSFLGLLATGLACFTRVLLPEVANSAFLGAL